MFGGPPSPEIKVVEVPGFARKHVAPDDYLPLPLLKDEIAAGPPREIRDEDVEESPALIYASWCPDPEDMVCVRVRGDSMEPTLHDGDIVAVNHAARDPRRLKGKVVALRWEGGATVKRLIKVKTGEYCGRPDNPASDEYVHVFPEELDRVLIGKVEWWWGRQK